MNCHSNEAQSDSGQSSSASFVSLDSIATGGEIAAAKDNDNDDVVWSLASNSMFVSGGLLYVAATSWDMHTTVTAEGSSAATWFWYNVLWTLGPLVYLLNAIVDVCWAWRVKQRQKDQKQHRPTFSKTCSGKKKRRRTKRILKRIRKHMGHRRELSAAVTFGIAAALSLLAMCVGFFYDTDWVDKLDFLSVHCYLLSAIFALCGRRTKPTATAADWSSLWSSADRLEDMGWVEYLMCYLCIIYYLPSSYAFFLSLLCPQ